MVCVTLSNKNAHRGQDVCFSLGRRFPACLKRALLVVSQPRGNHFLCGIPMIQTQFPRGEANQPITKSLNQITRSTDRQAESRQAVAQLGPRPCAVWRTFPLSGWLQVDTYRCGRARTGQGGFFAKRMWPAFFGKPYFCFGRHFCFGAIFL